MYDTMTTRQAGCVSNFSTNILVAQREQGTLQVSAYIRGAPGTIPEMQLDVFGHQKFLLSAGTRYDQREAVQSKRSTFGHLNPKSTTGLPQR